VLQKTRTNSAAGNRFKGVERASEKEGVAEVLQAAFSCFDFREEKIEIGKGEAEIKGENQRSERRSPNHMTQKGGDIGNATHRHIRPYSVLLHSVRKKGTGETCPQPRPHPSERRRGTQHASELSSPKEMQDFSNSMPQPRRRGGSD